MKVAVLGVGLIGGSIGLAARERLGAEVAGFDPDPGNSRRAVELGALDTAAASAAEALADAEVVFCAAPVRALGGLVREALAGTGEGCVVTDVGSTKRELVAAVNAITADGGAERFIGGHPIAGAETAGVEYAQAKLFEGARWYLTPNRTSDGVLYDRLQRLVAGLGARPQAIDADSHDRLMATVSHLPHVIANVLVTQAATTSSEESEGLPEVGPSFRDTTRVAGANPAIWTDIFDSNREAVAAEIDAAAKRLREASELIRGGDREAVSAWHREARDSRSRLLDATGAEGPLNEIRVGIENRPGAVAEIALELGSARVNIEDMALYPATEMTNGAVTFWVFGAGEAERAAKLVRSLGHTASVVSPGD
ncbi:prephenate dehydrogenase [soil metagenome]